MQPSDRKNKVSSEHQETYMSVGFLYYMIMARMNDLIPEENIWERVRVTSKKPFLIYVYIHIVNDS